MEIINLWKTPEEQLIHRNHDRIRSSGNRRELEASRRVLEGRVKDAGLPQFVLMPHYEAGY